MFNPNNVAFSFNFENNRTYLNWNFNSLFQAIELILAFNETNERKEVKMCKHCLKPFIAKNLKSDYDTASCRNVANVYTSCTYYLRDKKITNKTIGELDLLEENFNSKLENLYNELNEKIANILPINNDNVIEECQQYEPDYRNETGFWSIYFW